MKFYIYDCRRNNRLQNVNEFFYKFKFVIGIERYNNLRVYMVSKFTVCIYMQSEYMETLIWPMAV